MGPQNKAFRGKAVCQKAWPWKVCCSALNPKHLKQTEGARDLKATFSLSTLFTDNRPPAFQIRVAGCERQAGIPGAGELLTFDELSQIRFLPPDGSAGSGTRGRHVWCGSHLLQAGRVLAVEGRPPYCREKVCWLHQLTGRQCWPQGRGQGSTLLLFCPWPLRPHCRLQALTNSPNLRGGCSTQCDASF